MHYRPGLTQCKMWHFTMQHTIPELTYMHKSLKGTHTCWCRLVQPVQSCKSTSTIKCSFQSKLLKSLILTPQFSITFFVSNVPKISTYELWGYFFDQIYFGFHCHASRVGFLVLDDYKSSCDVQDGQEIAHSIVKSWVILITENCNCNLGICICKQSSRLPNLFSCFCICQLCSCYR